MVRSFAIIPAAGQSRRMGRPKLLMPWGSGCVIDQVLQAWCQSQVSETLVTVRADDEPLLQQCAQHAVEVVVMDPPPADMKASVQGALDHIQRSYQPQDSDVWMLAPADMPRLSSELINHVLAAHQPSQPAIIAPRVGELKGHPVLFPWEWAATVNQLDSDQGIRELWARHPGRTIAWGDERPLEDIDTPADYQQLKSQQEGPSKESSP
ncbi:MAG: nucleotidyltransferase family protein [Pirellulaceae bacterium]